MAKFVFRLEALITQREALEREAQLAVARLEAERLTLEEVLRGIRISLDAEREEWRVRLHGTVADPGESAIAGVDVSLVRLQASASLHQVRRAQQTAVRLAGVLARLDQARAELVKASAARKAVERLRERRYEAWRLREQQRENAALDELSVMRRPGASLEVDS